MSWKRKRSWTADTSCRLDADRNSMGICEQEVDFPWALIPNSDTLGEYVIPFLPRFLLQEIISAHCPYDDLFLNQPRVRANLLSRSDWLCPRGIASCECAIRCSACEQASSGELSSARRSLPAPKPLNKFGWKPAESQPQTGETTNSTQTPYHSCCGSTSGAHLCPLSASASPSHSRKFPQQSDWLSQRNRRH